ncbi:MAG: Smr/MutS family protein [Spirochaetes bacterium]|jgi:DNA-nicking Smr family endonuclease|nr:Smr/MutS family protein [Spirochaetota bacterium]
MELELGDELDLHHFHPSDTGPVVNEFIRMSVEKGYGEIRIVHGKGKSVKKNIVRNIIESHPDVSGYRDDGSNWGATVVYLKKDI